MCHDNSTRGLDALTALEYVQALRIVTDVASVSTILSIYQCGEHIYDLFDKVALLDAGELIYFGPATKARQYFQNLGYEAPERQTTSDFLGRLLSLVYGIEEPDQCSPTSSVHYGQEC